MADTRPATQIALDSVTPGFAERGNDGQGGIELSISRALSVSSFDGSHKNSTTNLEPLDTDPFDEDEVLHNLNNPQKAELYVKLVYSILT